MSQLKAEKERSKVPITNSPSPACMFWCVLAYALLSSFVATGRGGKEVEISHQTRVLQRGSRVLALIQSSRSSKLVRTDSISARFSTPPLSAFLEHDKSTHVEPDWGVVCSKSLRPAKKNNERMTNGQVRVRRLSGDGQKTKGPH